MALEFRVSNERPWSQYLSLYIGERTEAGFAVAEPLSLRVITPGEMATPTVNMPGDAAQQLMDELWRCGLRPSEGSGSAGSLAATERHLADMRALAFTVLKVKAVA